MSFSPGHPANATYPSPLCYVPFDINQPYYVPNVLAINALSEIRKRDMLEQLRTDARYQFIVNESRASLAYNLYFFSFLMVSRDIPSYFQLDNFDMSSQEFMGKQWSDIDAVKEFKRSEVSSFTISNELKISNMFRSLFSRRRNAQKMAVRHPFLLAERYLKLNPFLKRRPRRGRRYQISCSGSLETVSSKRSAP